MKIHRGSTTLSTTLLTTQKPYLSEVKNPKNPKNQNQATKIQKMDLSGNLRYQLTSLIYWLIGFLGFIASEVNGESVINGWFLPNPATIRGFCHVS